MRHAGCMVNEQAHLIYILASLAGPYKRDCFDILVIQDVIHHIMCAMYNVQHPPAQTKRSGTILRIWVGAPKNESQAGC